MVLVLERTKVKMRVMIFRKRALRKTKMVKKTNMTKKIKMMKMIE